MIVDIDLVRKTFEDAKKETVALIGMAVDEIEELRIVERIEAIFIEAVATAGVNTVNFIAFIAFVCDQVGLNQLLDRRQKTDTP